MSLAYTGVLGLAAPGGFVPGKPGAQIVPPAVIPGAMVTITPGGPLAATVTITNLF